MIATDDPARAHRRMRFLRHDAWRYVGPKVSGDGRRHQAFAAAVGCATVAAEIASIRLNLAALRFGLAAIAARKYDPDQPRIPAGEPGGGQWTDGGGGDAGESSAGRPALYVAGVPRIPDQRPPSIRARNAIIRAVAVWLAENGKAAASFVARSSWLYEGFPRINAYLDRPKSLGELHDAVSEEKPGYDTHHIVEQTAAERDGYPRTLIDREDNLVRVPTLKHWEINAWFQTRTNEFNNLSPREYLRFKDWDERRRVGLKALVDAGVLKP